MLGADSVVDAHEPSLQIAEDEAIPQSTDANSPSRLPDCDRRNAHQTASPVFFVVNDGGGEDGGGIADPRVFAHRRSSRTCTKREDWANRLADAY